MFGRAKLKREIIRLECRVEQLEFIVCGGNHQWEQVTDHFEPDCYGGGSTRYEYQCRKCGKTYKKYGA